MAEVRMASESQVKFLTQLLIERCETCEDQPAEMTSREAAKQIERLKALPRRLPTAEVLPAGAYVLDGEEYRVWRSSKRPDFVKVYGNRGSEEFEVPFSQAPAILARLAAA